MAARQSSDAVLDAARAAFEREPSPSMATLASATGLSLRQLYRRFGSRNGLLRALDLESLPTAAERILVAAFDQLGRFGLADLSMDELAVQANVSRATLYRLFPGKSILFRELITAYSPWEPIARVLELHADRPDDPPEQVVPEVAHALSEALSNRTAVLLRMVFEMSRGHPDAAEGIQRSMAHGLPDLVGYLQRQMTAGRLRRMHPVLALQMLAGPIVAHEMARPLAALMDYAPTRDEVVDEVVRFWLRAMSPDDGEPPAARATSLIR